MSEQSPGNFYRAFEDRFRGSGEEIRSRLAVYLPFVRAVSRLHPEAPVLDLGCGRGEWLELLRDNGIPAHGVDADTEMLQACRERGLDARLGDALAYLRELPAESQACVTGFHVAEHLPIEVLHAVMTEALRVLRPAGLLVLETPNPESLIVSSTDFYLDPTHFRPLPPKLLAFMAEYHGFSRVKLLRLQESSFAVDGPSLWGVISGVSPDYSVIAQKAAGTLVSRQLEDAFAKELGESLSSLSTRFDRALADGLKDMSEQILKLRAEAEQTRRHADVAYQHGTTAQQIASAANERSAAVEKIAAERHAELATLYGSRSWRVTAPLRKLAQVLAYLRGRPLPPEPGAAAAPAPAHSPPPPAPAAEPPAPAAAPTAPAVYLSERGQRLLDAIDQVAPPPTAPSKDAG